MATFTDDFNRADTGVNGGLGSNWTVLQGFMEILSNKVTTSTTGTNCSYHVATATADFADDHEAQIVVSGLSSSDRVSPMARCGSGTGYSLFCDGQTGSANRRITKVTGSSSFTTLGTVDIVPVNGDTVKIKAVGTTISAWINGVQIDSVTDSSYTTGQPGIMYRRSGTGGSKIDDFSAADIGSVITDVDTDETLLAGQTTVQVTGTDLGDGSAARIISGGRSIPMTNYSAHATSPTFDVPNLAACLSAGIKFGSVTLEIVT